MRTVEALAIFDIGETLVTGPEKGPASRIAARLGLDDDTRRMLHRALMTTPFAGADEVAAALNARLGVDEAALAAAVAEVWREQERDALPYEGAERAIRSLHDHGYLLGIVSNIWPPYLAAARSHFGALLDSCVPQDRQVYSFRAREMKPARGLFERVLARAGVPGERAVMVGDSYTKDVEPAAGVGIRTIWTLHRPERERRGLVRALNGGGPPATRTVESIAAVDAALVESVLAA